MALLPSEAESRKGVLVAAAPIVCDSPVPLSAEKSLQLIGGTCSDNVSFAPAVRPKAGEIYLFGIGTGDYCRCDQYLWKQNGKKLVPRHAPILEKRYFNIRTSDGSSSKFRKEEYRYVDSAESLIMVHYMGDEQVWEELPHKSRKTDSRCYVRTTKLLSNSVLSTSKENATKTYREGITSTPCSGNLQPVMKPRNVKQIKNIQARNRDQMRLSHDDLYNLHELAYEIPDFVQDIRTFVSLRVIMISGQLCAEMKIAMSSPAVTDSPFQLTYDTTFHVGDFYLSVLTFRHTVFKGSPAIPFGFMLHETKQIENHVEIFRYLSKAMPNTKTIAPLVCDREFRQVPLPSNLTAVYCWNHILYSDIRFWIRKHDGTEADVRFYRDQVKGLMQCPTAEEFLAQYLRKSKTWSKPFVEYFDSSLKDDILHNAGRWILEPLNIYSTTSGVTNNVAESTNHVIKHLIEWKERPLDVIVLSLHHLCQFYNSEIQRGKHSLGEFSLRPEYASKPPNEMPDITGIFSPDSIVARIKSASSESESNSGAFGADDKSIDCDNLENDNATAGHSSVFLSQPGASSAADNRTSNVTRIAMARDIILQKKITHVPERAAFVVEGSGGKLYTVRVAPKYSCDCPSVTICYHILAVQLSLNVQQDKGSRTVSLSQLRKNTRPYPRKRRGRKQPAPDDYSVVPAPDSSEAMEHEHSSTAQAPMDDSADYPSVPALPVWGGSSGAYGIVNTCPLDNIFAILYTYRSNIPNFDTLIGTTENEQALKTVLNCFDRGDFAAGKIHWVSKVLRIAPRNSIFDLWGSEREWH